MKGSALCSGKELLGRGGGVHVQERDAVRQGQQCKGGSHRELETENKVQRGEPRGQSERNEGKNNEWRGERKK